MGGKRILITGATGLIGREVQELLRLRDDSVLILSRRDAPESTPFKWLKGDLFDKCFIRDAIRGFRPTHLLNLAWCTTGNYLTSSVNCQFLDAGVNLAHEFAEIGGVRAVYAGTCFEYDLSKVKDITESDPLNVDKYLYTRCKNELRLLAGSLFSKFGVSFSFGRIFYAFGRREHKSRLTGLVLDKLLHNDVVVIKSGPLLRDYVYSKDVAGAFLALLDSPVTGPVNICTGREISIHDFVMNLANAIGRPELVKFQDDCAAQHGRIVGNNRRLTEKVGYSIRWRAEDAARDIVQESIGGVR